MLEYYFTFRSVTTAQRAAELLSGFGITNKLCRTPKSMAGRGCGYSLRICQLWAGEAATLLRREAVSFQRIYQPGDPPTEVDL